MAHGGARWQVSHRQFAVDVRKFSHSSPCSSSGRNGPNQVVGSSRFMCAAATSHLRSRVHGRAPSARIEHAALLICRKGRGNVSVRVVTEAPAPRPSDRAAPCHRSHTPVPCRSMPGSILRSDASPPCTRCSATAPPSTPANGAAPGRNCAPSTDRAEGRAQRRPSPPAPHLQLARRSLLERPVEHGWTLPTCRINRMWLL